MANAKSIIFVLQLFLCVVIRAVAQQTSGSLAVHLEQGITLPQVIQKLRAAKPDSNKVNLLIQQSHLYWYGKTDTDRFLDISLIAAFSAKELSDRLHFIKGSNEANFMICRASVEKGDVRTAQAIASKVYGEERVRILLIISEHYVFPLESRGHIDKAYPIIINAINTSKSMGSTSWYYQSLLLLGKYYFIKGDFSKGKKAILQIISACDKSSDYANEAQYWSEMGLYTPKTDSTAQDIVHSFAMAVKYFLKTGNKRVAASSLRNKAYADLDANQPDLAEKDGLEAISILNSINAAPQFRTYAMMTEIYLKKGNFPKALQYIIAGVSLRGQLSEIDKWGANRLIAIIYDELGEPKKALPYQKLAFDYAVFVDKDEMYYWAYRLVKDQIKTGETKNALAQLISFTKKYPPIDAADKELVAAAYGDLYYVRKDFKKAENYYLEMIGQDKTAFLERKTTLGRIKNIQGSAAFYKIGGFYIERKQFAIARRYLLAALKGPQSLNAEDRSNNEFLLFKADSALGNLDSAIRHFERSKNANDSMFNATKSRQISELEIQYETGQREKSFLALKNKSMLQNEELRRGQLEKTIILAGTALLLVIAGLAYNGYRNKMRSNLKLTKQQLEIYDQNYKLQSLLEDKDNLLTEKDWLLKEVHHRVKNNLQIVMSLLSSQSAYLKNTDALDAIRMSQNRVQAISLIHQKLYSSSDVARIILPAYVSDLVGYLTDCFDTFDRGIRIEQIVESFNLDLAQAVPLGLILNEAITNAIKYAFDREGGEIIIAIQQVGHHGLILNISDNGKGLPDDFDLRKNSSLGMEMMKSLSKQLGGELKIRNQSGLQISLEFLIDREFSHHLHTTS